MFKVERIWSRLTRCESKNRDPYLPLTFRKKQGTTCYGKQACVETPTRPLPPTPLTPLVLGERGLDPLSVGDAWVALPSESDLAGSGHPMSSPFLQRRDHSQDSKCQFTDTVVVTGRRGLRDKGVVGRRCGRTSNPTLLGEQTPETLLATFGKKKKKIS